MIASSENQLAKASWDQIRITMKKDCGLQSARGTKGRKKCTTAMKVLQRAWEG
jgi:hypothetical protein